MKENINEKKIRTLVNYTRTKVSFENEVLKPLLHQGAILAHGNNIYSITNMGVDIYMKLQSEAPYYINKPEVKARKKSVEIPTELYVAVELAPYDGRPGSLDFLKYPSRMGNRLIYRKDYAPSV